MGVCTAVRCGKREDNEYVAFACILCFVVDNRSVLFNILISLFPLQMKYGGQTWTS